MKLKMYSVYDSKAESYLLPFYMRNKGEALRAWQTTVNDPETNFCRFPSDFTLFEIGEFDQADCSLKMYDAKLSLGNALEFKNRPADVAPLLAGIEKKDN